MNARWENELEEQRIRRRNEVLDASRELFLEKDLPRVTMKDIARKVGISSVTLYKYFKSIDEIAFEVQHQLIIEIEEEFFGESNDSLSAYEQIENWLCRWNDVLREKVEHLRFQALFDHFYRTQYPEIEQVKLIQDLIKNAGESMQCLFEKGQKEGSIRTDITAAELSAYTYNNILAIAHRLAARGDLLEKESLLSVEQMMEMTIQSIIKYIKKS